MKDNFQLGKEKKIFDFPSGLKAYVKYIPYGLFLKVCIKVEKIPENLKKDKFSKLLVSCVLRENEKTTDLIRNLTEEDSHALLQIIIDDLGYREEFQLSDEKLTIQERLFIAHINEEKKTTESMKKAFDASSISHNMLNELNATARFFDKSNTLYESIKTASNTASAIRSVNSVISSYMNHNNIDIMPNSEIFAKNISSGIAALAASDTITNSLTHYYEVSTSIKNLAEINSEIIDKSFFKVFSNIVDISEISAVRFNDYTEIRNNFQNTSLTFVNSIQAHGRRFEEFYKDVPNSKGDYTKNELLYPPASFVSASASLHALVDGKFIDFYGKVSYSANLELEKLLDDFNPMYKKYLLGARSVLSTHHEDWPRHFSVSCRKLLSTLLAELAPSTDVWNWSANKSEDFQLDDNKNPNSKRPKRKARINYIVDKHPNSYFRNFIRADFDGIIARLDYFSKLTHAEYSKLLPESAFFTLQSIECFIFHILSGIKGDRFILQ